MRRRQTELTANARAVLRSPMGWGKPRHGDGDSLAETRSYPSALQVLAASEAGLMFWLVKLSGCRTEPKENSQ